MSWAEVKKINSDMNTPLNEAGLGMVLHKTEDPTAVTFNARTIYSGSPSLSVPRMYPNYFWDPQEEAFYWLNLDTTYNTRNIYKATSAGLSYKSISSLGIASCVNITIAGDYLYALVESFANPRQTIAVYRAPKSTNFNEFTQVASAQFTIETSERSYYSYTRGVYDEQTNKIYWCYAFNTKRIRVYDIDDNTVSEFPITHNFSEASSIFGVVDSIPCFINGTRLYKYDNTTQTWVLDDNITALPTAISKDLTYTSSLLSKRGNNLFVFNMNIQASTQYICYEYNDTLKQWVSSPYTPGMYAWVEPNTNNVYSAILQTTGTYLTLYKRGYSCYKYRMILPKGKTIKSVEISSDDPNIEILSGNTLKTKNNGLVIFYVANYSNNFLTIY